MSKIHDTTKNTRKVPEKLTGLGLANCILEFAPYAVQQGGWAGPGLETYPDIGQAAFGTVERVVISVSLWK